MLPALIYNNMDGGNSINNGSNYTNIYDESVILNSVRSRKKVTELPSCPVCSCTIRQGELESHMALEVDRLQKLSSGTSKRKLSTNSSSSNANLAVPGSSSAADVPDDAEVDVTGCLGGDIYQRVHGNRVRRLRVRRRESPPPARGECPVCGVTLPARRLQRHALRCLQRTGAPLDRDVPDTSSEEGSIDVENDEPSGFGAEYQWCGQWRVRASALAAPNARPSGSSTLREEPDLALVVDGDEDIELYGPPQYSPSRIAPDAEITGTDPPVDEVDSVLQNGTEVSTVEDMVPETHYQHKPNGLIEASAETRIQALKARIKELERSQNSGSQSACLICLAPYRAPAVSVQCWHVYCEECWLQSLKAKKICPQCNAITSAHHLRRIYM